MEQMNSEEFISICEKELFEKTEKSEESDEESEINLRKTEQNSQKNGKNFSEESEEDESYSEEKSNNYKKKYKIFTEEQKKKFLSEVINKILNKNSLQLGAQFGTAYYFFKNSCRKSEKKADRGPN